MKLTKHKGNNGVWIVRADGRDTGLEISKGVSPRWGNPQEWNACFAPTDSYLFEARGLDSAMAVLERVATALVREPA